MTGTVYLVGAGCGKADLITVRGLRLLQNCGAVVYDELIDPELLDEVPARALRLPMGKRAGRRCASQEEICRKCRFLLKVLTTMGLPLMDEELMDATERRLKELASENRREP